MNILHYVNVIIGFSFVMLVLSVIVGFVVQSWLIVIKSKTRAVGSGLVDILEDIGLDRNYAKQNIDSLLGKRSTIFGEKIGGFINKVSTYLLTRAPNDIGREEFVFLLLRKASSDNTLATRLGFETEVDAKNKLDELEKEILKEEVQDSKLPAQTWRTRAMKTIVPELASKIFAHFDETIDRVIEDVHTFSKFLGVSAAFIVVMFFLPIDAFELINKLNNNQSLAESIANTAEANLKQLEEYQKNLSECGSPQNQEDKEKCIESQKIAAKSATNIIQKDLSPLLFDTENKETNSTNKGNDTAENKGSDIKNKSWTPGVFATWIFVSLGSAFWLGILNKMLGIRSELSKKLASQREHRETTQH